MNVPPANTESLATVEAQLLLPAVAFFVQNALIGRRMSRVWIVPFVNLSKVLPEVKDVVVGAPCAPASETLWAPPWCQTASGTS